MNGKQKFAAVALSALALAGLIAGAALAAPALQGTTTTPGTAQATPQAGTANGAQQNQKQANRVNRDQYLANALGITTDALQTARTAANQNAIKAALAAGQITQAQADALLAGQRGPRIDYQAANINPQKLLADALNITVDKLQAAETTAYKAEIAQAVTDGRLTQAQADLALGQQALQKYIADNNIYTNAVQAAQKAGVLTQAQADALLKQAQNAQNYGGMRGFGAGPGFGGLEGFGGGPGVGGGRGHGRPGFGQPPANNGTAPATPGTSSQGGSGTTGGSGA